MAVRSEIRNRLKELEELRALVARLEDENADLLRMHAARLAEENERLSRGGDIWTVLTSQEEGRYLGDHSRFHAVPSEMAHASQDGGR